MDEKREGEGQSRVQRVKREGLKFCFILRYSEQQIYPAPSGFKTLDTLNITWLINITSNRKNQNTAYKIIIKIMSTRKSNRNIEQTSYELKDKVDLQNKTF